MRSLGPPAPLPHGSESLGEEGDLGSGWGDEVWRIPDRQNRASDLKTVEGGLCSTEGILSILAGGPGVGSGLGHRSTKVVARVCARER